MEFDNVVCENSQIDNCSDGIEKPFNNNTAHMANDMPTLLNTQTSSDINSSSVSMSAESSQETLSSCKSGALEKRSDNRLHSVLAEKSPQQLIEMNMGLHSLLVQHMVEQKRLMLELDTSRVEYQRLKNKLLVDQTHSSSEVRCSQLETIVQQSQKKLVKLQEEVTRLKGEREHYIKHNDSLLSKSSLILATEKTHRKSLSCCSIQKTNFQLLPRNIIPSISGLPPTKPDFLRLPGKPPSPAPESSLKNAERNKTTAPLLKKLTSSSSNMSHIVPNIAAALKKKFAGGHEATTSMSGLQKKDITTTTTTTTTGTALLQKSLTSPPSESKTSKIKPNHNRITLFWTGAPGSPLRVSKDKASTADMFSHSKKQLKSTDAILLKESSVFSVKVDSNMDQEPSVSGSIFESLEPSEAEELKSILEDERLQLWFTKRPNVKKDINTAAKTTAETGSTSTKCHSAKQLARRPSCLGLSASQKYHITVRCFKKEFDSKGGWNKFKESILRCELTKAQISLLLETIPDGEAGENNRKLLEWNDAVQRVLNFKVQHPNEQLYEDEEFVYYMSTIPDLYKRLSCMLIITSFEDLVSEISGIIESLMDALEILAKNKNIAKIFRVILLIGNYLNEGTALGDRRWFRISTLQKVIDMRGSGRDAKSLLHLIASKMGPITTYEEAAAINKAAQITIISAVDRLKQVEDIFSVLSEQSTKSNHIMKRRRRNSVMPETDDTNDRFAEVGSNFVRSQQRRFEELRQDLDRLLKDYKLCAIYFGDKDAFIPIDRRIEDERNPGQQRYVQDIFGVFNDWIRPYNLIQMEITIEKRQKPVKKITPGKKKAVSESPTNHSFVKENTNEMELLTPETSVGQSSSSIRLNFNHEQQHSSPQAQTVQFSEPPKSLIHPISKQISLKITESSLTSPSANLSPDSSSSSSGSFFSMTLPTLPVPRTIDRPLFLPLEHSNNMNDLKSPCGKPPLKKDAFNIRHQFHNTPISIDSKHDDITNSCNYNQSGIPVPHDDNNNDDNNNIESLTNAREGLTITTSSYSSTSSPKARRRASLRPAVFSHPSIPINDVVLDTLPIVTMPLSNNNTFDMYHDKRMNRFEDNNTERQQEDTAKRRRESLRAVTGFLSTLAKPSVSRVSEEEEEEERKNENESNSPFRMPPPLLPERNRSVLNNSLSSQFQTKIKSSLNSSSKIVLKPLPSVMENIFEDSTTPNSHCKTLKKNSLEFGNHGTNNINNNVTSPPGGYNNK